MRDSTQSNWLETQDPDKLGAQLAWQSAATSIPFPCGEHWGPDNRFLLEQVLAANARGVVYRASDAKMSESEIHSSVILKLRKDDAGRVEAIRNRRVVHPAVASVYDRGTHAGWHFTVVEYVKGAPLSDLPVPVNASVATSIFTQVANGIAAVHNVGLVHADIKPDNIMINDDGYAKIIDFDMASEQNSSEDLGGNLAFCAPERFGNTGSPTIAADVFALGGLLYWLLTGSPPNGENASEAEAFATGRAIRETPQTNNALQRIITKALEPDPDSRFGSAPEIAAALNDWKASLPPRGVHTPSWERAALFARRRPIRIAMVVLLIMIIAGAGVFVVEVERVRAREERKRLEETNSYTQDMQLRSELLLSSMTSRTAGWGVLPAFAWLDVLGKDPLLGPTGELATPAKKRAMLRNLIASEPPLTLSHDLARFTLAYMLAASLFTDPNAFAEFESITEGLSERWERPYSDTDPLVAGLHIAEICFAMHDEDLTESEFRALALRARDVVRSLPSSAAEIVSYRKTVDRTMRHIADERDWLSE